VEISTPDADVGPGSGYDRPYGLLGLFGGPAGDWELLIVLELVGLTISPSVL
jgi:hypothetical protein